MPDYAECAERQRSSGHVGSKRFGIVRRALG